MSDRIPEAAAGVPEPGAPGAVRGGQPSPPPPLPPAAGDGTLDPAEDLDVLFPDREVRVRDPDSGEPVTLTVRELRYLDSLEILVVARPFLARLADATAGGPDVSLAAVQDALAEHAETWLAILSRATGRDATWLARLSVRDGDALALALWTANADFFCRGVLGEVARRQRSEKSSTNSSGPGTAADTATSPAG